MSLIHGGGPLLCHDPLVSFERLLRILLRIHMKTPNAVVAEPCHAFVRLAALVFREPGHRSRGSWSKQRPIFAALFGHLRQLH